MKHENQNCLKCDSPEHIITTGADDSYETVVKASPVKTKTSNSRLLQMTQNIQTHFENINKYKRAREQVLDSIKNNQARQNYINNVRNNATQGVSNVGEPGCGGQDGLQPTSLQTSDNSIGEE